MERPTRADHPWIARPRMLGVVLLLFAACNATPSQAPVPTPACRPVTLSVSEPDLAGGFLGSPIAAPETGVLVQAVLAIGGNGPALTGRTIGYAAELEGPAAVTDSAGEVAAFEASTSVARSGADACPGTVRLAVPNGEGWGKGIAWVEATLGDVDVSVASPETCTSLDLGGGSVGVECPTVGVRIGDQASGGTLWLRLATTEPPKVAAALPDWASALGHPVEATPAAPAAGIRGSVRLDGGDALAVEGGSLVRSDDPELLVSLLFGGAGSTLTLFIGGYAGGSGDPVGSGELMLLQPHGGSAEGYYRGGPCPVEIGDDGRTGSITCVFRFAEGESSTLDVNAMWATDALEEPPVEAGQTQVSWRMSGGIVSEGRATVAGSPGPAGDASVFIVPDVPLEATQPSAVLRLRIVGFSGDGSYSGAAVDPAIDILANSPLLAQPNEDEEPQPWGPILGACTATVTDGGASGTMSCPGDPSFAIDPRFGGSVTLVATWGPAT